MYVTGTVSGQGPTPANSGRLVRSVLIWAKLLDIRFPGADDVAEAEPQAWP